MKPIKTIIIDDEPKAIELIKNYLSHFNQFKLIETFRLGVKALDYLSKETVDLVFLDINMPHLSGISLSKMIRSQTKIIFTTAYSEYALVSYEVNAVDYLLKPISFERFTKAVNKVFTTEIQNTNTDNETITIKSGAKTFIVNLNDISYLAKDGNYMIYYLTNQKILARESIAEALKRMPDYFVQSHKSFIVNSRKIDFITRDEISIDKKTIPIGASFKSKVLTIFQ